jgi:hypothetical protein
MELKGAMFTSNQMLQIEKASAALVSSGDGAMSQLELQQLYDQVFPRFYAHVTCYILVPATALLTPAIS